MKRYIVALIFVIAPGIAKAETINVFPGVLDDSRVIYTTNDNGETRGASAYKVNDQSWVVFDENGNSTMVNDFSELGSGDDE